MKNTFLFILLSLLFSSVFAQSHTITLSNGKEIYCKITQITDAHVVYTYEQDSTLHTDSANITEIKSITFNNHGNSYDESYYEEMFGTSDNNMLAEANRKYEPAQNRIAAKTKGYHGKALTITAATCLTTGAAFIAIGAVIINKTNQISYPPDYAYPLSISLLTLGSALAQAGIVILPIGCKRLAEGKQFKKKAGKYVPMLSLHPSVITTPQFPIGPAYGSGVNLTF
ncbi:MAG: hypothetical protein U0V74_17265 [Chitinophagales bacterium]